MLAEQIHTIPNEFYGMLLIGFIAQLIDGAVGLGYGVTCATSMMLLGIPLPAISGSIHTAEMFSSGMSGYSHYKFGNVNKRLLYWIAIPGVIGACLGAAFIIYLGNQFQTISYRLKPGQPARLYYQRFSVVMPVTDLFPKDLILLWQHEHNGDLVRITEESIYGMKDDRLAVQLHELFGMGTPEARTLTASYDECEFSFHRFISICMKHRYSFTGLQR